MQNPSTASRWIDTQYYTYRLCQRYGAKGAQYTVDTKYTYLPPPLPQFGPLQLKFDLEAI